MGFPSRLLPIVAIALLASACGSAASADGGSSPATSTSKPKVHLRPAQMVDRMVLHSGDLLNFVVRSKRVEALKDQLSPASDPSAAVVNRLTRTGWLASENSVIAANPSFPLVSDVNLFRSVALTKRLWAADNRPGPGRSYVSAAPAGSPAGAVYLTISTGKYVMFRLGWRQDRVIGQVFMFFHKGPAISPAHRAEIASLLSRAAAAESGRIAAALSA